MSIPIRQSVPPPGVPDDGSLSGLGVPELRRARQDATAELLHCRYLMRLVRARTDLLVAGVLGPLAELVSDVTGTDISGIVLDIPCDGVGERLDTLTAARRRLAALEARLDCRLEDVTAALVRALGADPAAALRTPPLP